jgi:abnormal spindle-like microcephaly-associated protein
LPPIERGGLTCAAQIGNLSQDLRDGIRLCRITELLLARDHTQSPEHGACSLLTQLRVPAVSRLQKVHNTKVAFEALKVPKTKGAGGRSWA